MINLTQLNKLRAQIDKNKKFIDGIPSIKADDNKRHSMALSMAILMEYIGLSQHESYDSITDDGGDNKLDTFYYSDDIDELTELVIIQSKYKNIDGDTPTFTEDEIKLCIVSCNKFLRGENFQTTSKKLQIKMTNYRKLLEDNDSPAISIKLFFATNGIIHEGHKLLNEVIEAPDNNIFPIFVDATKYGSQPALEKAELNVNIKSKEDKTDSVFLINDDLYEGNVVSTSISNIMLFYKTYGERLLLSNNVRYFLKYSIINKAIKDSFIEDPKRFCYLNNGITIVSEGYSIKPTGLGTNKVVFIKPSIVNGGQTVATLYQLYSTKKENYKEQFESANVLIRLYKAPKDYSLKIAKATNSQNPISVVDLKANDRHQEYLKNYLEKFGIGMIYKAGDDVSFYNDIITNENILQIYAALYRDDPAKAKTSKAATFKKYYDEVFNDSINEAVCKKLHRCYQISRFVLTQQLYDSVLLQNAAYSIYYAMKKFNDNVINENIPEAQIQVHFNSSLTKSMKVINTIISAKQKELKTKFSMNNLFKGSEIKDLIDIQLEKHK